MLLSWIAKPRFSQFCSNSRCHFYVLLSPVCKPAARFSSVFWSRWTALTGSGEVCLIRFVNERACGPFITARQTSQTFWGVSWSSIWTHTRAQYVTTHLTKAEHRIARSRKRNCKDLQWPLTSREFILTSRHLQSERPLVGQVAGFCFKAGAQTQEARWSQTWWWLTFQLMNEGTTYHTMQYLERGRGSSPNTCPMAKPGTSG